MVLYGLASPSFVSIQITGQAGSSSLAGLKGHRSVGGIRASIYNALPRTAVDALVDFMAEFERVNG